MLFEEFKAKMLLLGYVPSRKEITRSGDPRCIWEIDNRIHVYVYPLSEYASIYAKKSVDSVYELQNVQLTFVFNGIMNFLEYKDNPPPRLKYKYKG